MKDTGQDLAPQTSSALAPTACPLWQSSVLMLAAALAVYLPAALGAELLMFDDDFFFGPNNPEFREGLASVLTQPIANAYLPVAHLSMWFDYSVAGDASFWPHLHALLLHGLAGVMLARLLLQFGVGSVAAHIAAMMFVVHPALCESVAWVSSRKYVLSGLFTFAALFQVAKFARAQSMLRVLAMILLAAGAMLSNATSVVLPLLSIGVVLLVGGKRVRWLGPLVLFATILPFAWMHQQVASLSGTLVAGDFMDRLRQVPGAFWHYLITAVWPVDLNVLYPEVDTLADFRDGWLRGLIAIVMTVALGLGCWFAASARMIGAGLLAFVVALLPFNTAYPASSIAAADRYLYLALPWLALAIVSAAARLHRLGPWLCAVLLLPMMWIGLGRAPEFGDDETLWEASLAVDSVNAVAHYNLATAVWNTAGRGRRELPVAKYEGHLKAAIDAARYPIHELLARRNLLKLQMNRAEYELAAANALAAIAAAEQQLGREVAKPRKAQAAANLLQAQLDAFEPLQLTGEDAAADEVLAAATKSAPDSPNVIAFQAMRELAGLRPELLALAEQGKDPRLKPDDKRGVDVDARLEAALQLHPGFADLWLAQALWNQARGRVTAAIRCYRKATELRPDGVTAWLSAARMLRERGFFDSAMEYAQKGWRQRRDPRLLQELALSLVGLNRLDEAEQFLTEYLRLEPEDRDSGKILSNLLIGRAYTLLSDQSKREMVRGLVADSLRYNSDESKAHLVLGRLAHEEQDFAAAVQHLEKAFALMPDFAEAREQLTRSLAALGYAAFMNRKDEGACEAWLRCLELAPPGFDVEAIRGQLRLAWQRFETRGVKNLSAGKVDLAAADFRRCLELDPDQHWAAWLLATALHRDEAVDLSELEDLCRKSVAWQRQHDIDASQQVYLLAQTLQRRGKQESAREVAAEYLLEPAEEARPEVLSALKKLAGSGF